MCVGCVVDDGPGGVTRFIRALGKSIGGRGNRVGVFLSFSAYTAGEAAGGGWNTKGEARLRSLD